MTDNQPNALWLADMLEKGFRVDGPDSEAAAELRRLHALCDEMGEALREALQSLEYVHDKHPECTGGLKRHDDICKARVALAKWKED